MIKAFKKSCYNLFVVLLNLFFNLFINKIVVGKFGVCKNFVCLSFL